MSDVSTVFDLDVADYASTLESNDDAKEVVKQKRTRVLEWVIAAADSMATDTLSAIMFDYAPFACTVEKIVIMSNATITGHADNHATITVKSLTAAASAKATLGTYTTDSDVTGQGTLTAKVAKEFDISACTDFIVPENGALTIEYAKAGAGVVLSAGLRVHVHVVENQ